MDKVFQILKLIPALITAIKGVEDAIPDKGKGSDKLNMILEIIQASYDGASEIIPIVTKAISIIVNTFNKIGIFVSSKVG